MKKRILCIFLILQLVLPVQAAEIWTEKTEKTVTEGVRLIKDERFLESGWQRVHVLEIDLENENLELCTLFDSRGISKSQTVLKMAEEKGAIAAINGDFFNWTGTPLGFTVEDGKVISSPSHDPGLAAFMETEEGDLLFDYVDMSLFVTCPEGYTVEIIHINKYHSMASMVLYTSDWGAKTPGSMDGVSELVVEDGIVQEIRREMEGVEVPENGYVLATSTNVSTYLVDNFKPGDKVELSYTLTPAIENIKTAIGGGSVLVKDGKRAEFTNVVSGSHPRTAIGVDEAGKTLFLVAVEGRGAALPGFTQTQLADYMISLGAHEALNLDGGGSTTMVARNGEMGTLEVVNTVSDGAQRAVSTGLGVQFTGEVGKLSSIEIGIGGGPVLEGGEAHIVLGAYDEYHNPLYIADREITYTSNDGDFVGNIFYPAHSGKCTVEVSCDGVSASAEIDVFALPSPYAEKKPKNGESVLILPGKMRDKTLLAGLVNKRLSQMADSAETVFSFGQYADTAAREVARFSATEMENSLFVTIDAGLGSIRELDADQWRYLLELCGETEKKNVFFLLSAPLSAFSDSKEAALFERVISETLHGRGADVFVLSTGAKTEMTEKNGIRYVSVAKTADLSIENLFDNETQCGIRFTLEGDAVHFETVPLWTREGL